MDEQGAGRRQRRAATVAESKALGHPLRVRILSLCTRQELTNKELADRLDRDPGTVLYHVRQLIGAGLLKQAPVRTGESGALEKPYRSAMHTWWLDGPLNDADPETRFAPVEAFQEELREAGPESVRLYERLALHLSPADVAELDRRILTILDEYVETDDQRLGQPLLSGIFLLHEFKRDPAPE
ncbi:ArsR/SmtB family transcription factor [Amycolatopsis sp. H20-H5]|uniref:ArsR/SmtB family transcription factor n=1 Tax=Amycolatopsis sp. H20-H5 TaxID=3046309 RepID=UPI002DB5F8AD|nr:winged helix-turn-helix domain-containing protein [Amycolatopsis sp. H20-H5]MEC3974117.1 winged helix-turn-helix domain-containing protein [Amycolatopsis sp. H20-H5]